MALAAAIAEGHVPNRAKRYRQSRRCPFWLPTYRTSSPDAVAALFCPIAGHCSNPLSPFRVGFSRKPVVPTPPSTPAPSPGMPHDPPAGWSAAAVPSCRLRRFPDFFPALARHIPERFEPPAAVSFARRQMIDAKIPGRPSRGVRTVTEKPLLRDPVSCERVDAVFDFTTSPFSRSTFLPGEGFAAVGENQRMRKARDRKPRKPKTTANDEPGRRGPFLGSVRPSPEEAPGNKNNPCWREELAPTEISASKFPAISVGTKSSRQQR